MKVITVEPLLSGHLRGKRQWLLKRGWPLNRVWQKLPQVIKIISVQNNVKWNHGIS